MRRQLSARTLTTLREKATAPGADVEVFREVILGAGHAARSGMSGSPTLLIDGIEPFAEPARPAGLSCRLYRDDDGQPAGAPTVRQLRQAIGNALEAAADTADWLAQGMSSQIWFGLVSF